MIKDFNLWKFIISYLKPFKIRIYFIVLLSILMGTLEGFVYPKVSQYIVATLENSFKTNLELSLFIILFIIAFRPVVGMLQTPFDALVSYLKEKLIVDTNVNLRYDLFSYVVRHSHEYYKTRLSGAVADKIEKSIQFMTRIIDFLIGYFPERVFAIIMGAVALATVSFKLIVVIVFASCFISFFGYVYNKKYRELFKDVNEKSVKLNAEIVDALGNIATVRQTGQVEAEEGFLSKNLDGFKKASIIVLKKSFKFELLIKYAWDIAYLFTIGVAVFMAYESKNVSDYVLAFTVGENMMHHMRFLVKEFQLFHKTSIELKSILSDLLVPHDVVDDVGAFDLKVSKSKIEFINVSFAHKDGKHNILNKFNLVIQEGQKVALVGESGSGKTTLANLIGRAYDPQTGKIEIDGQDIKRVKLDSLHHGVAFIPQDPQMFRRTVRENISYGSKKSSLSDIVKSAKQAQIHDFIMTLPYKYDTLIGERGINLSGGQRQRIAIARAFLQKTKILILDEATSALDMQTEKLIRNSMGQIFKGKTVVMITHRLASAQKMDRIISLKNGKIAEDGTHSLLLRRKGVYSKLLKAEKSRD